MARGDDGVFKEYAQNSRFLHRLLIGLCAALAIFAASEDKEVFYEKAIRQVSSFFEWVVKGEDEAFVRKAAGSKVPQVEIAIRKALDRAAIEIPDCYKKDPLPPVVYVDPRLTWRYPHLTLGAYRRFKEREFENQSIYIPDLGKLKDALVRDLTREKILSLIQSQLSPRVRDASLPHKVSDLDLSLMTRQSANDTGANQFVPIVVTPQNDALQRDRQWFGERSFGIFMALKHKDLPPVTVRIGRVLFMQKTLKELGITQPRVKEFLREHDPVYDANNWFLAIVCG